MLRVPDDSPPVVTITASADFSLTTELSPPEAEGDAETIVVPPRENYRIEWTLQERLTLQ